MNKQYIQISGQSLRLEVNWNAITGYLQSRGKDSLQGLSDISQLAPSELAPLMAACIKEGERLDGRQTTVTAEWLGENCGMSEMTAFVAAFCQQATPHLPASEPKKG